MNQEQFVWELQKALQQPGDWHTSRTRLIHSKTGVYLIRYIIQSDTPPLTVYGAAGGSLRLDDRQLMEDAGHCLHTVETREQKKKWEDQARVTERFIDGFQGFD